MLYSYIINPTYTNALAWRKLPCAASTSSCHWQLPEAADVTGRIAPVLRNEVEAAGQMPSSMSEIDLPLVPVLARMEQAGVKIDRQVLAEMLSVDLERQMPLKGERDPREMPASTFNINSPKQLGDVLFNKLNLPKPMKYGKGKTISTAVDVLEELAADT